MKVYSADELATMSRSEQDAVFQSGQVRNLEDVPPAFLARITARMMERITDEDASQTTS